MSYLEPQQRPLASQIGKNLEQNYVLK